MCQLDRPMIAFKMKIDKSLNIESLNNFFIGVWKGFVLVFIEGEGNFIVADQTLCLECVIWAISSTEYPQIIGIDIDPNFDS